MSGEVNDVGWWPRPGEASRSSRTPRALRSRSASSSGNYPYLRREGGHGVRSVRRVAGW